MENRCPNCGCELPEGAPFCPRCETVLIEKAEPVLPRPRSRRLLLALGAMLALVAAAAAVTAAVLTQHGGRVFDEGGPEVIYHTRGGYNVRLFLTFNGGDIDSNAVREAPENLFYDVPSQLIAETDDPQTFLEEYVLSAQAEALPRNGADAVKLTDPHSDPAFPGALLMTDVSYSGSCGVNDVVWTLRMKNGDTVRLRHTLTVDRQDTAVYTPRNAPMDTAEELAALLERIEREVPGDRAVEIWLPPVTYDRPLSIGGHSITLHGGRDEGTGERTVFTAPVTVSSDRHVYITVMGIDFLGEDGIGLSTSAGLSALDCTFRGWTVGLSVSDGGWACLDRCAFLENDLGLRLNSRHSYLTDPGPQECTFRGNHVALEATATLESLLIITGSRFSGNSADVVAAPEIDLSCEGCVFE